MKWMLAASLVSGRESRGQRSRLRAALAVMLLVAGFALTAGTVPLLAGEATTLEHRGSWVNGQNGVTGMTLYPWSSRYFAAK